MESLSVEEDHHNDYDLNEHFLTTTTNSQSTQTEQERLRQRVFTSRSDSNSQQQPKQPHQQPTSPLLPSPHTTCLSTCMDCFCSRISSRSELLSKDMPRQKTLKMLVLSFFFISIYILTILLLRYSFHTNDPDVGVYRHYFFGFLIFALTPLTNYFLGTTHSSSFYAVQAFVGGRSFIALQGVAWFFYGSALAAVLYIILFVGLAAVPAKIRAMILIFAFLAQLLVVLSINYFQAHGDRRKYLPTFIARMQAAFANFQNTRGQITQHAASPRHAIPALTGGADISTESAATSTQRLIMKETREQRQDQHRHTHRGHGDGAGDGDGHGDETSSQTKEIDEEELDDGFAGRRFREPKFVTTHSSRHASSKPTSPLLGSESPTMSTTTLLLPPATPREDVESEIDPLDTPLPKIDDCVNSREPVLSQTVTITNIPWLQRAIDVVLIGMFYHTPLAGGLFIVLPFISIFHFGLIHPITVIIFTLQTYYYFTFLGDAHISGDHSKRSIRHPTAPLWQAALRYFDARAIVPSHDDLERSRHHSIQALTQIRHIAIPTHIDALLTDIVPCQDIDPLSLLNQPPRPADPPATPSITVSSPSKSPRPRSPISSKSPESPNEIVIDYDQIATHESLGLNIPYLFHIIGPARFNMLHEQAKIRGDRFRPVYDDLTFSHPQLILTNTALELNPLPPLSLIKLLQQSNHTMIATNSNSFCFTHHPHGIYPLSCFWSHKHSEFTKVFNNRLREDLLRNPELKYRTRYLPDFFGDIHPSFNRYECILHSPCTSIASTPQLTPEPSNHSNTPSQPDNTNNNNSSYNSNTIVTRHNKATFEDHYLPAVLKAHQFKYPQHATKQSLPVDVDTLGATVLSHTPTLRELFLAIGGSDVSRDSLLLRVCTNRSIILVPSGQKDMLYSNAKDRNFVFYTQHLGFIKLALRCGLPLIPIVSFGENQILHTFDFWAAQQLQLFIYKLTRAFVPMFPHGPLFTLWPNPTSLTIVLGDPLFLPVIEEPTDEIVKYYHNLFYTYVARLFFTHREAAGFPDATLRFF